MNGNLNQLEKAFNELFNSDLQRAKLLIKVLSVLIEILDTYRINFSDESLLRVNRRSLEILNIAHERLEDQYVVSEQVEATLSEWLGILTAKTPEYIIVLESLIKKAIVEDRYDFSALNFVYDILHESKLVEEARKAKSAYRIPSTSKLRGTKDLINDYVLERVDRAAIERETERLKVNQAFIKRKQEELAKQALIEQERLTESLSIPTIKNDKSSKDTGFHCYITNEKLHKLFNWLISNSLLSSDTSFEVFQDAFSSDDKELTAPMVWQSKTTELAYILHMLQVSQQQINGKWQNHFGNVKKAFMSKQSGLITSSNFSSSINYIKKSTNRENAHKQTVRQIFDTVFL